MKTRSASALCVPFALLALAAAGVAQGQHTARVTVRIDGRQIGPPPSFGNSAHVFSASDDGRYVTLFEFVEPQGPFFLPGDIRLLDRVDGSQVPIILGAGGAPLDGDLTNVLVSPDGSRIIFESYASNLPGGLGLTIGGIYILHRPSGQLTRATNGIGGDPDDAGYIAAMTPDGRYVLFSSFATNLVANDNNFVQDAFVADMQTGQTTRVSVANGGIESAGESSGANITDGGRYVVFSNTGDDLVAGDNNNNATDVFLRDVTSGTTELISVTPSNVSGNGESYGMWVSNDGRFVAFVSHADDLVAGDNNGFNDIFVRDRQSGTTTMLLLTSSGAQANHYVGGRFSSTGRYLVFSSSATNVVPGDTNQQEDMFLRDLLNNTTERLTLTPTGGQVGLGGGTAHYAAPVALSSDGRFVTFYSSFVDLIEGDSNLAMDGFIIERLSNVAPVTTYCTAKTTSTGCVPVITSAGQPRASGLDSFYVSASQVRTGTRGAFIWSFASSATPFGGGTLCLTSPYQLEAVASGDYGGTSGPCNQGQFVFKVSHAFLTANGLVPGTTLFAQYLSRDNGFPAPNKIGLTDAITFTIAP